MEGSAEWQLTDTSAVMVYADAAAAGGATLIVGVSDLDVRGCGGGGDRLIVGRFADDGADGTEGDHGGAAVGGPALPPWPPLEAPPEAGRRLMWWEVVVGVGRP